MKDFNSFMSRPSALKTVGPGQENPRRLKDQIMAALPGGGNLNACTSCGICASGCPASGLFKMDPRKLVRLVLLGLDDQIMANDWVWVCTICNRCVHACPMKIDIPGLVMVIRAHWPVENKPPGIRCLQALNPDPVSDLELSMPKVGNDVRKNQDGVEGFQVPVDKKGARLFINHNSRMPLPGSDEMGPLWKTLHLAGDDWTCGIKGGTEKYGMFLSDENAWEGMVRTTAGAVDALGCKVLVNTECGQDTFAMERGLERFDIPHAFEVKHIIEYYADWIRTGRLKVNSDWNMDKKIKFTVQDPCWLVSKGAGDSMAESLRRVVKTAVGKENFIEMYPSCANSYCCGGGGGASETDFKAQRLEYGKIKVDQILETRADYCITPCRSCYRQIQEAGRFYQADFNTVHLWTILCLSLGVVGEKEL